MSKSYIIPSVWVRNLVSLNQIYLRKISNSRIGTRQPAAKGVSRTGTHRCAHTHTHHKHHTIIASHFYYLFIMPSTWHPLFLIFAWLHHLFLEIFSSLHCPCLLNLPILICFHYAFCLFILNCHCTFTFLSLSRDAFITKAFDKNFSCIFIFM